MNNNFQSFNWLRGVADDHRISIIHRLILIRILIHRQKDGQCDPGYNTVAKELGVDRKTVMGAVDVAVRFGWLAPPIRGRRENAKFVFIFPTNQEVRSGRTSRADQEVRPQRDFLDNQEVRPSELRSPSKGVKKSVKKEASQTTSKASEGHGHLTGKENGQKSYFAPPVRSPEKKAEELSAAEQASKKNGASGELFDRFWAAYPRRVAKEAARKAFAKAIENGVDPELLIAGAKRYAAERYGQDPRYTKHPTTWLNGGCWHDDAPSGGPPIIDGVTGEEIVPAAPPRRRESPKTWAETADELLRELDEQERTMEAPRGQLH